MEVDSFKFLPRLIEAFYKMNNRKPVYPIPWTPVEKPLSACKFGLVTSAGLYHQGIEPPFDVEREKREPTWGDPSYRTIQVDIPQAELGASHLHINTRDVLEDINILLPVDRFRELVAKGTIGGLAEKAYSFMGYQGYPPDTGAWRGRYAPEVAQIFVKEEVDCVFLTPA